MPVPDGARDRYLVLSALGHDRPGLMADLTAEVTGIGLNIVDVEVNSAHGVFMCFMVCETMEDSPEEADAKAQLEAAYEGFDVPVQVEVVPAATVAERRNLQVFTIVGEDKRGIFRAITETLANFRVDIVRIHHLARGDFVAFEMLVDTREIRDMGLLKEVVQRACRDVGVDVIVQPDSPYRTRRRLVVFDMDSTLIQGEVIDRLAEAAGAGEDVERITREAMEGRREYKEALRERVRLLKGLRVEDLERIADGIELAPGAQELVGVLKDMGFKVALITGGFAFFADRVKERLGLDHAFANRLEVEDGVLTGEVVEPIIDAEEKGRILAELAAEEGLRREEVVAIGDGSNDTIMLKNAGLAIGLDPKEVLAKVADGTLTKRNLKGLLYCLGAHEG